MASSRTVARRIVKLIWSKKGEDVVLLDLKKISGVTDYFLICSAGSDVQAQVIADSVVESMDKAGQVSHVEGYQAARWILVDCFSVIVHVFRPEVREYYGLERLWGDAPREEFPDEE